MEQPHPSPLPISNLPPLQLLLVPALWGPFLTIPFCIHYPPPPPPIPQAIRVNTKRETFLKKWRTQDTIIQEETFIGIDKWGHVKDKFRQVTWAWNGDIGQQKWWQMIQRWAETATATEKSAIKNNNISKSDMASSSICEMIGFERQGTNVTPLPPGGPHKSPLSYPWSNLTPVPFESPTFHISSSY